MRVSAWMELRKVSRVMSGKTSSERRSWSSASGFVMLRVMRILLARCRETVEGWVSGAGGA